MSKTRLALKQVVRRYVPLPLLRQALTWRSRWFARRHHPTPAREVFSEIYAKNLWGGRESVSGPGSAMAATRNVRAALARLVRQYGVRSMLDAPCGDFNWMQTVDLAGIAYVGGDIVTALVEDVSRRFGGVDRRFVQVDLTGDRLPSVDLIFCRDCFIHLPFKSIHEALANFLRSDAKYILLTTFTNHPINFDTTSGGMRALDLCAWPFNFPEPIELIPEEHVGPPSEPRKHMGLWSMESLRPLLRGR